MSREKMSFVGGVAAFNSKYASQLTWCNGVPHQIVVDTQVVTKPASPIQFERNQFQTEKPDEVLALVYDKGNFERNWGWFLDPACLPEVFREFWKDFAQTTRIKIIEALAANRNPDEVFTELTDEDLAPVSKPKVVEERRMEYACPVSGCSVRITDEADPGLAQARIVEHVRLVHPNWSGGA